MEQNIRWGTDTESPYLIFERMGVYRHIAPDIHTHQPEDFTPSFRLNGRDILPSTLTGAPTRTTTGAPLVDSSHLKQLKVGYHPIKKTRGIPDFIDAYLNDTIRFEDEAYLEIRRKCSEILKSEGWGKLYGKKTVDEIMDELRGRR